MVKKVEKAESIELVPRGLAGSEVCLEFPNPHDGIIRPEDAYGAGDTNNSNVYRESEMSIGSLRDSFVRASETVFGKKTEDYSLMPHHRMVHIYPTGSHTEQGVDGFPESFVRVTSDNTVITSKYQWYSFVPLFVYEFFSVIANFYFLIVCVGQSIAPISSTNGIPVLAASLFLFMVVDGIFAAIEDLERHVADKRSNYRIVTVLDRETGQFHKQHTCAIRSGDIVRLDEDVPIPADVLILSVNDEYDEAVTPFF